MIVKYQSPGPGRIIIIIPQEVIINSIIISIIPQEMRRENIKVLAREAWPEQLINNHINNATNTNKHDYNTNAININSY